MTLSVLMKKNGLRQVSNAIPATVAPDNQNAAVSVARIPPIAVALINPIDLTSGIVPKNHEWEFGEDATAIPAIAATEGDIQAVLIDSKALGAPIWFAFSDEWRPDQGHTTPIFFASELPSLGNMTEAELRRQYELKRTLGGWIRNKIDEPTKH